MTRWMTETVDKSAVVKLPTFVSALELRVGVILQPSTFRFVKLQLVEVLSMNAVFLVELTIQDV